MDLISSRAVRGFIRQSLIESAPEGWINAISAEFNSDQDSEQYAWLSDTPALRKWKGGRNIERLTEHGIKIINEKFETGLEFKKSDMRRDKLGQIKLRISEMSRRAGTHWGKLGTELIESNPTSYDGKAFFATNHKEGKSPSQSNLLSASATSASAPTSAEMKTAVLSSVQSLIGLKDGAGEPVSADARRFIVIIPTNMFAVTAEALNMPTIVEGGAAVSNTLANLDGFGFAHAVNPRFTATDAFYVARTDSLIPSIIRQNEYDPRVSAKAEGSDFEFDNDSHQYGIDAGRAVGPGRWQNMAKVVFS